MDTKFAITKLEAARRQLETAIRLYFSEADPVSIHTLTLAAYDIIRNVSKKRGGSPMVIKDELPELVNPKYKKMFRDKLNEAQNFFKHADRDADSTLRFCPAITEKMMWDACEQYCKLTSESPPLFRAYIAWFKALYPKVFDMSDEFARKASHIAEAGRAGFLEDVLPLLSK